MRKRKRIVRSAITDKCSYLADQILTMNLPKEILVNALKDLYVDGRTEGYLQHVSDSASFRKARRETIHEDWDTQKTAIDDRIHGFKQLTNK
jgi:hypothetical protein